MPEPTFGPAQALIRAPLLASDILMSLQIERVNQVGCTCEVHQEYLHCRNVLHDIVLPRILSKRTNGNTAESLSI